MNSLLGKLPYTEYCERHGSGTLTAEPVNVLSTIVLFISAYYIFKIIKKKNKINDKKFIFLPLWLAISALGNIIYHTMPNPVAYIVDVGSLGLFWLIVSYLFFSLNNKIEKIKGLLFFCLVFIVIIYLRQLDQIICNNFIIGTHFILHILIAVVAYYAVKSLLTNNNEN